jgi:hypothetical protein
MTRRGRCVVASPGPAFTSSGRGGDAVQENSMTDEAEKRGRLIRHLEEALALADEMEDGQTGFLIERALSMRRDHVNLGRWGEPRFNQV